MKVRKGNGVVNRLWEELCFACTGEWFGEPDVVGVVLSVRSRDDNISIWHLDSSDTARRMSIGEKLKDLLNLDESTQLEYKHFRQAMQDNSSFRNAKAYVYAPTAPVGPVVAAAAPAVAPASSGGSAAGLPTGGAAAPVVSGVLPAAVIPPLVNLPAMPPMPSLPPLSS